MVHCAADGIVCSEKEGDGWRERETIDSSAGNHTTPSPRHPPSHRDTEYQTSGARTKWKRQKMDQLLPNCLVPSVPLTFAPTPLLAGVVKDFKGRGKREDVSQQCTRSWADLHLYYPPPFLLHPHPSDSGSTCFSYPSPCVPQHSHLKLMTDDTQMLWIWLFSSN